MNPELPLRDIHAAPAASLWPLSWGWWVVTVLALIAIGLVVYALIRRFRHQRRLRVLRADVGAAMAGADNYAQAASACLRRLIVRYGGRSEEAALIGDAWAERLASPDPKRFQEVARQIAFDSYKRRAEIDRDEVRALLDRWIVQLAEPRHA